MRADRLVSILLLLQVHGRLTGRSLAERLEVSERTVLRDMEALGASGVPLVAERGPGGGWQLVDGYQTKLTGLTPDEIRALFFAHPPQLVQALGVGQAAEAAWLKLQAALPAASRETSRRARNAILVDPSGWREAQSIDCLPTLVDALWQRRRLRFHYESGVGAAGERLVDPLGLVARGSVWYLVAARDREPRTYRVSRMKNAAVDDAPSTAAADFDLAAYWEASTTEFREQLPQYRATYLVAPAVMRWVRYRGWRLEEQREEGDRVRIRVCFDVEEEALQFALAFGADAYVVEPHALRARVVDAARATLCHYAGFAP